MKREKIYCTRRIPKSGLKLLQEKGFQVNVHDSDLPPGKAIIMKHVEDVAGFITLLSDTIDQEVIERARNLKVIANYAAGYNNIDVAYAKSKGIVVTNTPDILTDATADLTWALMLAVSKRVAEGDRFVRLGKFNGWTPHLLLGGDVSGKTLGIVGAGRIGKAVARRARGFEMSILYYSRQSKPAFEKETGARMAPLDELLRESDYVSLHCPLTDETYHLLDESRLKQMKSTAYLINTSRGAVVNEQALAECLLHKTIAGAGLDVYENEPQINELLLPLDNVVLLPHIGSATLATRSAMARMAAENIVSVLEAGKAIHPVPDV